MRSRRPASDHSTSWLLRSVILALIGPCLIIAVVLIASDLHSTLNNANAGLASTSGPSAIQITQVYTESLYKVVVAIGVALGGYFLARSLD